jgi:hypothetical protein
MLKSCKFVEKLIKMPQLNLLIHCLHLSYYFKVFLKFSKLCYINASNNSECETFLLKFFSQLHPQLLRWGSHSLHVILWKLRSKLEILSGFYFSMTQPFTWCQFKLLFLIFRYQREMPSKNDFEEEEEVECCGSFVYSSKYSDFI